MSKPNARFVAKAQAGVGWRVWDRKSKRWWGNWFGNFPTALLVELNGRKRPQRLVELSRSSRAQKS